MSFESGLGISAVKESVITLSWYGKTLHTLGVDGVSSVTEVSQITLKTFSFVTMVPRLIFGNSQCMTLQTQPAIVSAWNVIKELDYALQGVSKDDENHYSVIEVSIYSGNKIFKYGQTLLPYSGKYAVYDNWESWSQCSASCGGGKRNRNRVCLKSDFPPKNDPQTERLISTYGSLSRAPLTIGKNSLFDVNSITHHDSYIDIIIHVSKIIIY